jgi:hypothetical protein
MSKVKGFLDYQRQTPGYRPVDVRIADFQEVELSLVRTISRSRPTAVMIAGFLVTAPVAR